MNNSPNFESVTINYVCDNPSLFNKIDSDFFKDDIHQLFFKMIKFFYLTYKIVPFDIDTKDLSQFKEFCYRNLDKLNLDKGITPDENIRKFMAHAENILACDHRRYSPKFLTDSIKAWIEWENATKGYKLAMEFRATAQVNPQNVKEIITKCKQIVNQRSTILWNDEVSIDFFDAEAHKQTSVENLMSTGYPFLNLWLSGDKNGGFEKGTVTLFVGESNIGKSIWLANLALNMAINGTNVLLVSLEMKAEKIFKRMGSNAFNIPMDQYKDYAANTERMIEIMRKYKEDHEGFEPVGELRAKKFTSATVDDIRAFKRMEEDRLGIKFGAIVLDYFTELENSHGTDYANMYIYHKQNSNDLFNFAGEDDIAVVSAHQLAGVAFGADDLFLTNLGESKGIIHRVDNIIGIIQPPGMKLDNKYVLKNLKPRDGGYKNYKIHYDIDYSYMRIKETEIHEKPGEMVVGKID